MPSRNTVTGDDESPPMDLDIFSHFPYHVSERGDIARRCQSKWPPTSKRLLRVSGKRVESSGTDNDT